MSVNVEALEDPPRLLAQDGAAAHAEPGSAEAFRLALRIGSDGISTRAWTTAEGDLVVGRPRRRFRRAGASVSLDEVHEILANASATLALVVEDPATASAVLRSARVAGVVEHLWLCAGDIGMLVELRAQSRAARLLHVGDPTTAEHGAERHAARLREVGIDGVVVAEDRATAGFVTLMHRFGRIVVAAGADHERTARRALGNGVDAVAGVDVEVLRSALDERRA